MDGTRNPLPTLSKEKTIRYLNHLGIEDACLTQGDLPQPTFDLLCELQTRHCRKIPFETITQHFSAAAPSLPDSAPIPYQQNLGRTDNSTDALFDKIVVRKRGGYCFELNGLFSIVLRSLGYNITNVAAQVYEHIGKSASEAGWDWQPLGHQCTIVDFPDKEGGDKKRYHVDVGFGGPQPDEPMLLGSETEQYSLPRERLPFDNPSEDESQPMGYTLYKKLPEGERQPLYHYADRAVSPGEYAKLNRWSCSAADAPMVQMLFCTMPYEHGRKTILYKGENKGAVFTKGKGDNKEERTLKNLGEFKACLKEEFDITLTGGI